MSLSDVMDIAVAGTMAQRTRLTITASNLANAETTRTADGGPYRRRDPVFVESRIAEPFDSHLRHQMRAVEVSRIQEDPRDFVSRYMPGHPDADETGHVLFPNVNIVEEQTNLLSAQRSFEANVMVIRKARAMADAILKVGA